MHTDYRDSLTRWFRFWAFAIAFALLFITLNSCATTKEPCGSYSKWEAKTKFNK